MIKKIVFGLLLVVGLQLASIMSDYKIIFDLCDFNIMQLENSISLYRKPPPGEKQFFDFLINNSYAAPGDTTGTAYFIDESISVEDPETKQTYNGGYYTGYRDARWDLTLNHNLSINDVFISREHTESGQHKNVDVDGYLSVDGIFIVEDDGNIGIGTTSPSALLDINGNASIEGNISAGGIITATSYYGDGSNLSGIVGGSGAFTPSNDGGYIAGDVTISGSLTVDTILINDDTITGHHDELVLNQTGDVLGACSLILRNRSGYAGALFKNSGLELFDFIYEPLSHGSGQIRWETRGVGFSVLGGDTEWQFGLSPISTASNVYLALSEDAHALLNANVGIGTAHPDATLDVAGDIYTTGNLSVGADLSVRGIIFSEDSFVISDLTISSGPVNFTLNDPSNFANPTRIHVITNESVGYRISFPVLRLRSHTDNTTIYHVITSIIDDTSVKRSHCSEVSEDLTGLYQSLTTECVIYVDPGESWWIDASTGGDSSDDLIVSGAKKVTRV